MNLYRLTTERRQTSLYPPITSFIAIAESVGEAENIVKEFLKKEEVIITSVSLLNESYRFSESDYYLSNKNNTIQKQQ
jgi:hypothetical protein